MFNNSIEIQEIKKLENISLAPLSKAHIRPKVDNYCPISTVEYIEGASLLRTCKGNKLPAVGGGGRGGIKGFSKQSRRRLLELIACVRRDADLPCFVTLTYPDQFPSVDRAKRDLKIFEQRLQRKFINIGYIWKLEPQKRGAPHYHMLIWGVDQSDLFMWVVQNWYEIAGNGDLNHYKFHAGALPGSEKCVNKVRSFRGVWSYASKYIGKTFEVAEWGKQWVGRFWGVGGRNNIPLGINRILQVTQKQAIQFMRYQRRFMHMRTKRNLNSLKTFCNPDQWIYKLLDPSRDPAKGSTTLTGSGGNRSPEWEDPAAGPEMLGLDPVSRIPRYLC